jgi:hypothetical protein
MRVERSNHVYPFNRELLEAVGAWRFDIGSYAAALNARSVLKQPHYFIEGFNATALNPQGVDPMSSFDSRK